MKIVIVGMGYVGLPLAIAFSEKYHVIGYDVDNKRILQLLDGFDKTAEFDSEALRRILGAIGKNRSLTLTSKLGYTEGETIFFITVPTPINSNKEPDLHALKEATKYVGSILRKGDTVIYESTVYPGCTEEDCVPILEESSGLTYNKDFFCGYSPERINIGDKVNTLKTITKITSGSNRQTAEKVDALYASIITAGTYKVSSIKVAEAAKAIENAQRDLNISFVNELALIFDKMGIDTSDVIDAASTKWNFLKFKPGLVGGHCIGVDPYYLTYKAKQVGYIPEVILSGRKVNENIGVFVAEKVLSLLAAKKIANPKILVLGITFKENCPDIRNSGVFPLYKYLISQNIETHIYDPWADPQHVYKEYSIHLQDHLDESNDYDAVILAVAHTQFASLNYKEWKKKGTIIYDVKSFLDRRVVHDRL